MERLSSEILYMIAAEAAASRPHVELDKVFDVWDLHDKLKVPSSSTRPNSLAPYASVSRGWQLAFEPFTFETLILSPKRLAQAERQGYLTQRRLGYVRTIAVPITFPLPWPWDVPIVFSQVAEWPPAPEVKPRKIDTTTGGNETAGAENVSSEEEAEGEDEDEYIEDEEDLLPPEERGYDKILASIIRSLFRILKLAPVHENKQPYIDLRLGLPVPREYGWCFANCIEEPEAERTEVGWCKPLYLDLLLNQHELPELPVIASCSFEMPRLKKLKLHLSDKEWRDPLLRVRLRDDFASSLTILPETITDFELHYSRRVPRDHSYTPVCIVPPNEKHDHLSKALFSFSQRENLVSFSANGSFEMDILGPWNRSRSSAANSAWSRLEHYEIGLLVVTPFGQWLAIQYTDNPNTDSFKDERWGAPSEWSRSCLSHFTTNEFRGPVDPEYAHDLVCAAGRAAVHMPCLKTMKINVGVVAGYKVSYTSKKVEPCMRIVGKKLQPPNEDLLRIWRRVALDHDQKFVLEWSDTVKTNKRKERFQ
ncbi:hypothetical protein FSARC_1855 [Fusarium sarcochroum]|uniref:DUF6546 domain-containing protein n=1 Tax=Fusarium sarcochroum TaxID=1208366 RepID=A0A8H4XED2_9HYPO|nr:hypothetical protein FSARC_1855 [Fusarium sarcochroum]